MSIFSFFLFSVSMLVAKQVEKQASIYFIFGIFAHICSFVFIIYAMMLLGKIFLYTCLGICIITLACFHMPCMIMFAHICARKT